MNSKTYILPVPGEANRFHTVTFHVGQRIAMRNARASGEITKLGKFIYAYMDFSDKTVRFMPHEIEALS